MTPSLIDIVETVNIIDIMNKGYLMDRKADDDDENDENYDDKNLVSSKNKGRTLGSNECAVVNNSFYSNLNIGQIEMELDWLLIEA